MCAPPDLTAQVRPGHELRGQHTAGVPAVPAAGGAARPAAAQAAPALHQAADPPGALRLEVVCGGRVAWTHCAWVEVPGFVSTLAFAKPSLDA